MKIDERVMDIMNGFVATLQNEVRPTVEKMVITPYWRKSVTETIELTVDDTVSQILTDLAERLVKEHFESNTPER